MARALVSDIRAAAAGEGRDPRSLRFFTIVTVIVAPTDELAAEKYADYRAYASLEGALARYSALMHIDLSALDPDEPLSYVETDGIRGMVELFTRLDDTRTWTPREIAGFCLLYTSRCV